MHEDKKKWRLEFNRFMIAFFVCEQKTKHRFTQFRTVLIDETNCNPRVQITNP